MNTAMDSGESTTSSLRIRTTFDSAMLQLPELARFVGKTVDIEVTERTSHVEIQNGAELVAYWRREGLISREEGFGTSSDLARSLRERAQNRAEPQS